MPTSNSGPKKWTCPECQITIEIGNKASHLKGKKHKQMKVQTLHANNGLQEIKNSDQNNTSNMNLRGNFPSIQSSPLLKEWTLGTPPVYLKYIRTLSDITAVLPNLMMNTITAVDCEGVPKSLDLIQIATSQCVFVIDCVVLDADVVCGHLKPFFESDQILKLFHDLHKDVFSLNKHGIHHFSSILDTQLASEFLWDIQFVGLNNMFERLDLPNHPLKSQMSSKMRDYPDMWRKRPLQKYMIEYAALDAVLLLQAHTNLGKRLGTSLGVVMSASSSRARFAMENNGDRSVCFDKKRKYRMASVELLDLIRPQDTAKNEPLRMNSEVIDLLEILPEDLRIKLIKDREPTVRAKYELSDIVLDLGRRPCCWMKNERLFLSDDNLRNITRRELDAIISSLGGFGSDNRAGLEKKLHRISGLPDRDGVYVGLTMRVGRWFQGNVAMILDLLLGSDKSILILGEPGSGKSTIIRETVRVMANDYNVCVVDTSNEIGGDGAIPHPCIGLARRMMVPSLDAQSGVMVECVQNHTPHVMCIDEIGRPREVAAAHTVKQRGVRMIASAHGDLRGLVKNREIRGLIGGLEKVTLGDEAAKEEVRRKGINNETSGISKMKTQRMAEPTFEIVVEVARANFNEWRIIQDSAKAVDDILDGKQYKAQLRIRDPHKTHVILKLIDC
mmetsp:Transcript_4234/g.4652  ORF Transcript_4234/g.4652 Transcript_4234/m.4652 type:complete len:672 (-) Transcript_4234:267-2282(-)